MAKFKLTNKAVDDLSQIWNYSAHKWNENQADIYYRMILENCKELALNPDIGKSYTGITEDLKGFKVGRYIIFYRKATDQELEIIRILHEQMDLRK